MANFQGSKTENNLKTAFAGESQACLKYQYYASQAKKDGYIKISQIFEETAKNEKEHAKIWFKQLHGGSIPATPDNLKDAISGENYEHTTMYQEFAKEAREEGFEDIAKLFEMVGEIEARHEKRYQTLLQEVADGSIFRQSNEVYWICTNCGHVAKGAQPPEKCPVCSHERAYFVKLDNAS